MIEVILIWLVCGGIAAMIASNKGGSGAIGFLLGVLLGPFGIIAALFMGDESKKAEQEIAAGNRKKCPRCAELVQPDALVCKHCGHEFVPA